LQGIVVDRIISSPSKRTMQTAEIIGVSSGIEIETDKLLLETNHGAWEGQSKEWISAHYPDVVKTWTEFPSVAHFPDGESFSDTVDRTLTFINSRHWTGTSVIVTHDNIVRILVCLAEGVSYDRIWDYEIFPAAINRFEVSESHKIKLVSLNEHEHLKGLLSDMEIHAL